ncbi:MAG: acyl-CoA/acyl-ACP dehydrogenase [Deltaproteobacteria bacterium]|nr:acyl-CoA/acyl-ACP dehydrogenase [Deltaproteobacteria bacterium]NND27360.1 acyl-CoA/acyl-ACP dehydrogenase [Myxococcales bacterium]MBT8465173.1 acyl-CoA/acyl-ACP dehydrogenase [Deltaproteobacteria bacterium]MBT8482933.1 acyl-CoA/acyl-ACP dehydrogenase [Deltaproteobacteria bacterium]NNK08900.1 acyl-CoA/acyl-ACP dehydrogenase [Myxococcales bacterium]
MDFSFTDDQNSIRDLVKQVLRDIVTDESLKALAKEGRWFHERAWRQLAESEMLGLAIPEDHGGAGMGITELCLLLQQVGRTVAPIPAIETLVSSALPLAEFGTAEQKDRFLGGIAQGRTILTAALVDTGSRNPLNPSAVAEPNGADWRLRGRFSNVAYADRAERILVPARSDSGSIVVCLVDPKAEGVRLGEQRGTNGQPLWLLELQSAPVAAADVLGGAEHGEQVLRYLVDRTDLAICAVEYGIAEQALFMTATYSGERKQFRVPIGTFQGVTQRVGDAYIDVQAMRSSMWQACWRLDEGLDAAKELAVAKFFASEAGARVVAAAQHVHGGMGFDRDYPLYRYFMTSKHLEFLLGGTSESLARLGELISA